MIIKLEKLCNLFPLLTITDSFQFFLFTPNIKIENNSIFTSGFASKNINFVGQIFYGNGNAKSWENIKSK